MMPTCLIIAAVVTCQALGPRLSPAEAAQVLVATVSSGVVPVFAPAPDSVTIAYAPPVLTASAVPSPWAAQIPLPWPAWYPHMSSYGTGPYGARPYGGRRPVRARAAVVERQPTAVVTRQDAPAVAPVRSRAMVGPLDR